MPLKVMLVADDGREFKLPEFNEWFAGLSDRAQTVVVREGHINSVGCEVFWEWLGRDDPAPKRLNVFLDRDELEEMFPAIKGH